MDFSTVKAITIPEGQVKKIECNGAVIWEEPSSYKNWAQFSTESDGTTIYNGGKGYKDGYRLRSGGAEAAQNLTTITGYIPYVKGDKLFIYPPFNGKNTTNTINFYDGNMNHLGQVTDVGGASESITTAYKTKLVNGVSVLDISSINSSVASSVAYVRIGNNLGWDSGAIIASGSEMIITKNEEIA